MEVMINCGIMGAYNGSQELSSSNSLIGQDVNIIPDTGNPVGFYALTNVCYLPHVKEPVTKGHLSCRDAFSQT